MTEHATLKFRDLVSAACEAKGLTQHQLAFHANVSQTAISLVGNHKRKLQPSLAEGFAKVLGQTSEFWLEAFGDFNTGRVSDLAPYLDGFSGGFTKGQSLGTSVRRLLNHEILQLFDPNNATADCKIKGFDIRRIGIACYYCRLGFIERNYLQSSAEQRHDMTQPVRHPIAIAKGEQLHVRTLEDFHFPYWLEADFQASSNVSRLGLSVTNGPTIDPGYEGRLSVTLMNHSDQDVTFDPSTWFLKLRFSVFDGAPTDQDEFINNIRNVEDEDIFAAATADEF